MGWLEHQFPAFASACGRVRYKGERQGRCSCPNTARHRRGDKSPSLLVMLADNGGLIFSCRAGCTKDEVLAAAGLRWRDICHDRPMGVRTMSKLVKTYPYRTPDGEDAFEVCRFQPKAAGFPPRRLIPGSPAGQEWVYSIVGGPVHRVRDDREPTGFRWVAVHPYRPGDPCPAGAFMTTPAPFFPYNADLLAAEPDRICFWCEGEKDADAVRKLGLMATTTQGGSGGKHWRKEWGELFRERVVVLLPDNDQAGYDYAAWNAGCLVMAKAAGVIPLRLPGLAEKGDVSDWLFQNYREPDRVGRDSPAAAGLKALVAKAAGYTRRKMDEMFPRRKKAPKPDMAYRGEED